MSARRVRIVGPGRAGGAFALALDQAGWGVEVRGRGDDLGDATDGVDLVLLCVPDPAVATVAAQVDPADEVVVAHCAGSLGLDVLAGHRRVASVHPLVALTTPERGAAMLRGAWFGVAGDPLARQVVQDLGGTAVDVPDEHRLRYHAAAVIASNHLVALLGQVERVAATVDVPLEAYLDLVRGTVDNVAALGPSRALTGPVARGDLDTVERHLAALPPEERGAYGAMVEQARRLVADRGRAGDRPPGR